MDEKGFDPIYDDNKSTDIIYVGKKNYNKDGSSYRKVEMLFDQEKNFISEKNSTDNSKPVSFEIKDEIILHETPGGQQKIHCWLMEESGNKHVRALRISRRTARGVYGSEEITLDYIAMYGLKLFLDNIYKFDTLNEMKYKIPLSELTLNIKPSFSTAITENEFEEIIKANINSLDDFYDLLSVKKRKIAISKFEKIISGEYKNEVDIQKFLQKNIWMFGNEYAYVVEDSKINEENILDIIPQNFESFVDIIEVKLPSEDLFNYDSSHNNYYTKSGLTKAISQTQNYIFELENKTNDEEYQKKNNCKIIRPRGIILYGSNRQLNVEETKYLRILNSSFHNLQVMTYQQLLEKAQNTIKVLTETQKG